MSARDDTVLIVAGTVAVIVLFYFAKKQAAAVVDTAGGILSGNNALTAGTAYDGWGFLGTLGAGTNAVLGGAPNAIGEWLGGKAFDLTH